MEIITITSSIVGLLSLTLSIVFWRRSKQESKRIRGTIGSIDEIVKNSKEGIANINNLVNESNQSIADNKKLISQTTKLLEVADNIGIIAAYENRINALIDFEKEIVKSKRLIVIGSSLKGLTIPINKIEPIIRARTKNNLPNRFLLTHPCYSIFREQKEFRGKGDIHKEIDGAIRLLKQCRVPEKNVRLYLGTPTVFTLITDNLMLLNPYPYQIEAYKSFCLVVERKKIENISEIMPHNDVGESIKFEILHSDFPNISKFEDFKNELNDNPNYNYMFDVAQDIYGQYYWYQYLLPWYSKYAISVNKYEKECKQKMNGSLKIDSCIKKMRDDCIINLNNIVPEKFDTIENNNV